MNRDLRRYARQTNARVLAGFILLLVTVGGGLVWLIFGPASLPTYFLCLLAGLAPLLVIWGVLALMDWIVRRSQR